jgi:hypothetical protein
MVPAVPTAVEVADRLYEFWNAEGLRAMSESVDPEIELISDPLRPEETALRGIEAGNSGSSAGSTATRRCTSRPM